MKKVTNNFISLMNVITIKTLLTIGSEKSKQFLINLIKSITSYDITNFTLGRIKTNNPYERISSQEDILLISPNKDIVVNVELNRIYSEITLKKNRKYAYALDQKYNEALGSNTKIIQININDYSYKNAKGDIILKSKETLEESNITIYNIYLQDLKTIAFLTENKLYNDLAMFSTYNFESMKSLIKDSQERRKVMEELKKLGKDKSFLDLYNHEEYIENLKKDFCQKGYEEGIRHQKEKLINAMLQNHEEISKISLYSDYSKDDILSFLLKNNDQI